MNKGSLVVVGSGIKYISHLTHEAKLYIEKSDVVLYLVNEPLMQSRIQSMNPKAESLDKIYLKHRLRSDCYKAITEYILEVVRRNLHVCVVFYGHPMVLCQPGVDAASLAKQEGFYAKVLPGISAEACLYADLMIDPGTCGIQSFEATDFLIHKRQFDINSHLLLWQIDIVGVLTNASTDSRNGLEILIETLSVHYGPNHLVTIYEAAQYPSFEPQIISKSLSKLIDINLSRISTLYIPPKGKAKCDVETLQKLNINLRDLLNKL